MTNALLELSKLKFRWPGMREDLLDISAFQLARAEQVFLSGPSGSGKSTLLSLFAGIHQPTSGDVSIMGKSISTLSAGERDRFRAEHIGYIFQQFNLLGYLSVLDNVLLGCRFSKQRQNKACERSGSIKREALRLLADLGLNEAQCYLATKHLSVGQQQRVAAARALIGAPSLIIADEPTSALDAKARSIFIELLARECQANQIALLFVSHDDSLAQGFGRHLRLADLMASRA